MSFWWIHGLALDQIEAHVEKASVDVNKGRGELGAAVRFKVSDVLLM